MLNFDMVESLLVISVSFFLGFCLMIFVGRKYNEFLTGINYFILYYLFLTIGSTLIFFRTNLPIFITIIVANTILFIGKLLLLYGISTFYKMTIKKVYLFISLSLFASSFVVFTYIFPNVTIRIILYTVTAAAIHFLISMLINKQSKKTDNRSLMFLFNVVYTFYFIFRASTVIITKEHFVSFLDYNNDAIMVLLDGIIGLLMVIGLYDMISNKFSQEMIEMERSKNQLLDNMPGFAYRCLNDENWTMLFISNAFEDITGYNVSDLINNRKISYNKIIVEEYREMVFHGFKRSILEKTAFNIEYEIISFNGSRIWVWEQGKGVYDKNGNVVAIEGLVLDISKRKNDEKELKKLGIKNKKMELIARNNQKLGSIGVLASGVAHEINNPINGILNYGQIFLDTSKNNNEDLNSFRARFIDFSKAIIKESNRISLIVNNLLQFSREHSATSSSAPITDIIHDTLSLVSTLIKRDHIILEVNIAEDISPSDSIDLQIQQVLMNLIINAKDALNYKYDGYNDNKKLIIFVEKNHISNKNRIRIVVEDHGNGIPYEIRENIFDPFFTTKKRTEGTGLGLSISYGIVKDNNGELTFETEESAYTKFYIDIPLI